MEDLTALDRAERNRFGMNHFIVCGNDTKQGTKGGYIGHFKTSVACTTIDEALALVRAKRPNCVILSVSHQGTIEVLKQ
jgi:hypothetical protein